MSIIPYGCAMHIHLTGHHCWRGDQRLTLPCHRQAKAAGECIKITQFN